jgi:hypothetical protein
VDINESPKANSVSSADQPPIIISEKTGVSNPPSLSKRIWVPRYFALADTFEDVAFETLPGD